MQSEYSDPAFEETNEYVDEGLVHEYADSKREYGYEDDDDDEAPRPIGRGGSFLFSFLGFVLTGAGVLLAAAPYYSWQVQALARQLAGFGVSTGVVLATGVGLFACGRLGRSFARLSARPPQNDPRIADSVGHLAAQISTLARTVANMQEQVTHIGLRDPIINVEAPAPDDDLVRLYNDQKDAVFRLAAGLDKLAKNVTDQVAGQIGMLDNRFEAVRSEIRTSVNALQMELVSAVARNAAPISAPMPAPAPVVPAPVQHAAPEVVLENPHPEMEAEVSPLSFLDGLKDIAPPSQNPHAPNVEPPPLDFDQLDGARVDGPPAALPGQQQNQKTPTRSQ